MKLGQLRSPVPNGQDAAGGGRNINANPTQGSSWGRNGNLIDEVFFVALKVNLSIIIECRKRIVLRLILARFE